MPGIIFSSAQSPMYEHLALCAFSLSLRTSQILVVTHGAFLHFLAEDWDVDGNGGGNPLLSMC